MNWRSILGIILVGSFVYLLAKGIESGTIGKIEIGNPIEGVKEKISGEKARKEEKKEDVEQKTEQGKQGKGKEEVISSKLGVLPSFAEIVEKVSKGVVNISTTRVEEQPNPFWWFFGPSPGPGEEFFRRFFGEPQRRIPTRSLGSGFLISPDGYIVTNSHVVRGATDINVTLWDGRTFKAKIVGIDDATDIAVLKIDATDLPYLKFGDSNELRVGDWVIAIGNPFGLGHTVTVGVVSAKGRSLGITRYEDFIQTDAAINPGNSGGPLINIKGEVVGINTAILNPSGMSVNAGIGFAIPSSLAKDIVPTLIAKGKVERAWIGVYIQEVTPEIAKQLGLKEAKGALVSDVVPGSPADKAGIKRGDVIIEFDGKKVETWRQLPIMVSLSPVNKKAKLKIIRDGKELEFEVVLAKMPEEQELARQRPPEQRRTPEQGVELKQFGLTIQDSPDGPKVVSVEPGSPAQMAGIMRGDIIVEVNRKQVKTSSEIANILKDQKSALFLINREGRTIFVAIRVG
jgi:serine protease Do